MSECYEYMGHDDKASAESEGEPEGEAEGEPEGEAEGEGDPHHAHHKYCFTKLDDNGFGMKAHRMVCEECG